jgi:hypothetical protein
MVVAVSAGLPAAAAETPGALYLRALEEALAGEDRPADRRGWAATSCAFVIQDGIDVVSIALTAAGTLWGAMNTTERNAFVAAVRSRALAACRQELVLRGRTRFEILRVRETSSGVSLTVRCSHEDGSEKVVTWRLRPGGAWGWLAQDLILDGGSMAGMLRAEVERLAARPGADAASIASALAGRATNR